MEFRLLGSHRASSSWAMPCEGGQRVHGTKGFPAHQGQGFIPG